MVHGSDSDITALAIKGGAIWLGTRSGYLLILDTFLMTEGKDPLLGLQQCGRGKVKCIVPITNATSKFQVCALHVLFHQSFIHTYIPQEAPSNCQVLVLGRAGNEFTLTECCSN